MLTTAINEQQRNSMAMQNALRAQIYETVGLPVPQSSMIDVPRPVINRSPVTYNNIHINKSVVGNVNTAQVGRIDVALDNIQIGADDEVKEALKAMTEAVANSLDLHDEARNELIEHLTFLAEQASMPPKTRQKNMIGMVLKTVPGIVTTFSGLGTLWAKYGPVLEAYFKI